ncbi:glycosyltransferase [Ktedonosporobacter rubrisoli]|uniref:Glycosyltransferase n=1 Tax=Ktedonosporobacter rubrisoli TaxID=2509675 RepID=A0A4P6JWJ8_KTERU|nr:glycosyltransferase [Ktedonosporobacter rubrisoli]QBD79386.1 glycosyltransferase [Ktedonosporobacter rubrisoli]
MATKVENDVKVKQMHSEVEGDDKRVGCSIGIMAYNEEANIARTLRAVLAQEGPSICIKEVIVVASGCTDHTVPIVSEIAEEEPRVRLLVQEKREGKASAINLFLKKATSEVAVLIGADVIPDEVAIENLCSPFQNPEIGMVGGRPVPVNDPATFMGHAVHLLWRLHDRVARIHPKLGEVIAFRNVISGIPTNSAVDEISIQALISQLGYKLVYNPACVVYNKGPITVRDFLKQRRRIYAGHLKVKAQQNYEASTMKIGPIVRQLIYTRDFTMSSPRQAFWTLGAVSLEGLARMQGYYDFMRKREHHIWQMVETTKDLEAGQHKVRRICNAQSVIVLRCIIEGAAGNDVNREREDREATEAARKLLPSIRAKIRKEDILSVNGPGILTAVIRAEQQGAEIVAERIKRIVETSTVRVGLRGREVKVHVAYSSLTFASKAPDGTMTVKGPLMNEELVSVFSAESQKH